MPKAFAQARQPRPVLVPALLLSALLSPAALAQTATPATAPVAAPAVPQAPAPAAAKGAVMVATSRTVSALAIPVSKAIGGKIIGCPRTLKASNQAVCLYSKSAVAGVRGNVKSAVGNLAIGDWKMSGQAGSLLLQDAPNGKLAAYILTMPLAAQETLVVLDAVQPRAAASGTGVTAATTPAARPAPTAPAGVVKGQPYLLDSDLAGVVNVINLGGGKYRLNAAGQTALTINVGSKTAQRPGGNVELPLAPLTDGKYLIFPVSDLRALGCTVTDAAGGVSTIACGSDSVGVKPIVF